MEQRAHGFDVWKEPLVALRVPDLYNLRSDPFERAKEEGTLFYGKWMADRAFMLVPAQAIVGEFLKTFKEFPPRQKPASFSIDQALEKARQPRRRWPRQRPHHHPSPRGNPNPKCPSDSTVPTEPPRHDRSRGAARPNASQGSGFRRAAGARTPSSICVARTQLDGVAAVLPNSIGLNSSPSAEATSPQTIPAAANEGC